jgi:hypothetical protein
VIVLVSEEPCSMCKAYKVEMLVLRAHSLKAPVHSFI